MIRKLSLSAPPRACVLVLSAAIAACAVSGCYNKEKATSQKPEGPPINGPADLHPDLLTLEHCSLELAGTKYKADIRQMRQGSEIQIDLMALDAVIESERYAVKQDSFCIVDAGGERYNPPIPLIKYPMNVGDSWSWSGSIWTGPEPHKTTAKITTSSEDLTINGSTVHGVVRVDVDLSIYSGRPSEPSKRKLKFWIAPNMGVVKRSFGDYSTREP